MIENEDQILDVSKLSELKVFDQVFLVSSFKPSPFISNDKLYFNITRLSKFYLVTKQYGNDYDRILCNLGHTQKLYKEAIKDYKKSKETFIYDESKTFDIQLLKDLLLNWKYRVFTKKYGLTKNEYCYEDAILEYKKYFRFDIGEMRKEKSKVNLLNPIKHRKTKSLKDYHDDIQLELNFESDVEENEI